MVRNDSRKRNATLGVGKTWLQMMVKMVIYRVETQVHTAHCAGGSHSRMTRQGAEQLQERLPQGNCCTLLGVEKVCCSAHSAQLMRGLMQLFLALLRPNRSLTIHIYANN
jgi:hypothetical protein